MLTLQSDNGKQGYKVGGKKYRRPKVVDPFPEALANGIAAIGFGDATNPELAAWYGAGAGMARVWRRRGCRYGALGHKANSRARHLVFQHRSKIPNSLKNLTRSRVQKEIYKVVWYPAREKT